MRDADIDLARLLARKDTIHAKFQAQSHAWQALQGAALAAFGFGFLAWVQGILNTDQMLSVAGGSGIALLVAARLGRRLERILDEDIGRNDAAMERLKEGGSP